MAVNSLSPAFIRLRYTVATVQHTMTLPTSINGTITPGVSPNLNARNSPVGSFTAFIENFSGILDACFSTDCTLDNAELWSQPEPTDNPIWVYTAALNNPGDSGTPYVRAEQMVFTFRSNLGGLLRIYLMETFIPPNQTQTAAQLTSPWSTLVNYVIGDYNFIKCRDNGWPILSLGWKSKTNDVLRRSLITG